MTATATAGEKRPPALLYADHCFLGTAIHYSGDIGAWLKAGVFFPVAGGFSFFGEEDDPKSSCLLPLVAGCFRLYGGAVLHAANI